MRATDFIKEGDVIKNKFGLKQQQKGKAKYKYNEKIAKDIPMFDPRSQTGVLPSHTGSGARGLEPFERFEVRDVSDAVARMYGITQDGQTVYLSAGHKGLFHALADSYNRGGFTDMDLEKINLGPEDLDESSINESAGLPWTIKSAGEGDFYIQRKGNNAGTPFKERRSTSDYAITVDQNYLVPDYLYYVMMALQQQNVFKRYVTGVIPGIRKADIDDALVKHFQSQAR